MCSLSVVDAFVFEGNDNVLSLICTCCDVVDALVFEGNDNIVC